MKKFVSIFVLLSFLITGQAGTNPVYAQDFVLPAPGVMVHLSPEFNPPILKGIKVYPENPFRFDFILDRGDSLLSNNTLKDESVKLIKYFLAGLTISEKDLWVNLSPYEKDRIIPDIFGLTEMGRDLLAEDYMLKQITASLIYPEDETGRKFWNRVYEEAARRFGTTNIPVNTFNKVWIVPEKAVVYENAKTGTAYVVESKLKVMLEQDYLSLEKHRAMAALPPATGTDIASVGAKIVREIVIPELTTEVNENKNFVRLRQVYNSLILATWYKRKIKDSILFQVYSDKNKVAGVNIDDPREKQKIYDRYLRAFKKGVYNYIKEEQDPLTQQLIPRKYFSGGEEFFRLGDRIQIVDDQTMDFAMRSSFAKKIQNLSLSLVAASLTVFSSPASQNRPATQANPAYPQKDRQPAKAAAEAVPALAGQVALKDVGNNKNFPRTGIYRIGQEFPGKPSVLFIHGARGSPHDFIKLLAKYNGEEANIFVFKYDYKKALENANDLGAWLRIWAAYVKPGKGIIVAHSFGNNILVEFVEDLQPDDALIPFLKRAAVYEVAPTFEGSPEVERWMKKPGGGLVGRVLGLEKLAKAQMPGGKAIMNIRNRYPMFKSRTGKVSTVFASRDVHNGKGEDSAKSLLSMDPSAEIILSTIPDHTGVLNDPKFTDQLSRVLAYSPTNDHAMRSRLSAIVAVMVMVMSSRAAVLDLSTPRGHENYVLKNLKSLGLQRGYPRPSLWKMQQLAANLSKHQLAVYEELSPDQSVQGLVDRIKNINGEEIREKDLTEPLARVVAAFANHQQADVRFIAVPDNQLTPGSGASSQHHNIDWLQLMTMKGIDPSSTLFIEVHLNKGPNLRYNGRVLGGYPWLLESTPNRLNPLSGFLDFPNTALIELDSLTHLVTHPSNEFKDFMVRSTPRIIAEIKRKNKNIKTVIVFGGHGGDTGSSYSGQSTGKPIIGANIIIPKDKRTIIQQTGGDKAMKGGIDLTPANMKLTTQSTGREIRFHLDPDMLARVQNAPGFVPVIINIQPVTNLRQFLGLNVQVNAPVAG
jgi:hypothetical protein